MLVLKYKSIAAAIVAHAIIVCSCVENVNMVVVYFEGAYGSPPFPFLSPAGVSRVRIFHSGIGKNVASVEY